MRAGKRRTLDTRRKTPDSRFETLSNLSLKSQVSGLKSSSGVSLIAVMWIITILSVLASEFLYSMQLEIRIARNWSDQTSAFYAAKGGLETAIAILRDDETDHDSLDEDWTEELTDELNNSTYTTTVIDESSKINVNTTDEETLTKAIAYCMGSTNAEEILETEATAEAQALAAAIIEKRPYRTVAGMAKATDMTPDILYGSVTGASDEEEVVENTDEEEEAVALVDIITVYSVDKNVNPDGENRTNISSASADQIQQGINPEGQEIITQQEAQAIVDYRGELGGNQPGQGGQGGSAGPGAGAGGQNQQEGYSGISQLFDIPAISQNTFNSIRNRITTGNTGGNQNRININTADANQLQSLDGIDQGIADSIVRYRGQNPFDNVNEIREVKLVSIDDMRAIVDRVTTSDEEALPGKVNINTAPLDILAMLPGLDEEKAQLIIDYRTVAEGQESLIVTSEPGNQEAGPFTSLGQLLDVEGIDEQTFRSLVDHIAYRSHAYMIESEGRSSDGKIVQNCTAVIDRTGQRIKIEYWKQQ